MVVDFYWTYRVAVYISISLSARGDQQGLFPMFPFGSSCPYCQGRKMGHFRCWKTIPSCAILLQYSRFLGG